MPEKGSRRSADRVSALLELEARLLQELTEVYREAASLQRALGARPAGPERAGRLAQFEFETRLLSDEKTLERLGPSPTGPDLTLAQYRDRLRGLLGPLRARRRGLLAARRMAGARPCGSSRRGAASAA